MVLFTEDKCDIAHNCHSSPGKSRKESWLFIFFCYKWICIFWSFSLVGSFNGNRCHRALKDYLSFELKFKVKQTNFNAAVKNSLLFWVQNSQSSAGNLIIADNYEILIFKCRMNLLSRCVQLCLFKTLSFMLFNTSLLLTENSLSLSQTLCVNANSSIVYILYSAAIFLAAFLITTLTKATF